MTRYDNIPLVALFLREQIFACGTLVLALTLVSLKVFASLDDHTSSSKYYMLQNPLLFSSMCVWSISALKSPGLSFVSAKAGRGGVPSIRTRIVLQDHAEE